MPKHRTNLDALILREDFQIWTDRPSQEIDLGDKLKLTEISPSGLTRATLRKPDFQRETADWTPEKIYDFIKSFLGGDLIPALIMWRSQSGNIFVIDGAHRLSALIAWVYNDYGDGIISRGFYGDHIPREQEQAANRTRQLVEKSIGSYAQLAQIAGSPGSHSPEVVLRSRNIANIALTLQWVKGNAEKAETSFYKINKEAVRINETELRLIEARNKPQAIAARALIHAGTGHKYWSKFDSSVQIEIEAIAKQVYQVLFQPNLDSPIKTLDLPIAGKGYSADSLDLIVDFVSIANNKDDFGKEDSDGSLTIQFLKNVRAIVNRISGLHPSSLGLHPVVYFYSVTGRYQPPAFLTIASLIKEMEAGKQFEWFTDHRERFEEFLLQNKLFVNQIVVKQGGGMKSVPRLLILYKHVLGGIASGKTDEEIVQGILAEEKLKFLRLPDPEVESAGTTFKNDAKSAVFLKTAQPQAARCNICGARLHLKSITIDHITPKRDGGLGTPENGQAVHPYCNSGYKESRAARGV